MSAPEGGEESTGLTVMLNSYRAEVSITAAEERRPGKQAQSS